MLAAVEPEASTLCEGWTVHDLAIHLWTLNHDPISWPAAGVRAFEPFAARRGIRIKQRWSYPELVERLRAPRGFACMPTDRWENHRHALGEYYVHTQDVARPNGVAQPTPDEELEEALWRRTATAARALFADTYLRWPGFAGRPGFGGRPGFVLRHPDGRQVRIGRAPSRTVTGKPSELIVWVYGRRTVAQVEVAPA